MHEKKKERKEKARISKMSLHCFCLWLFFFCWLIPCVSLSELYGMEYGVASVARSTPPQAPGSEPDDRLAFSVFGSVGGFDTPSRADIFVDVVPPLAKGGQDSGTG